MFERLGFTSGRSVRAWLASLLLLGTVIHVAQFPVIERNSGETTRALYRYDTSDLLAEGLDPVANGNAWSRYAYAVALAEIAPGSTVYQASDAVQDERRLYGFGKVAHVYSLDATSAELLGAEDPLPFVVARGPGGKRGAPWLIALAPGTGDYGDLADPDGFIFTIFDADARRSHDGGPPRVFVDIRWKVPADGPPTKWDFQRLLIEASLLGLTEEDLTS